MDVPYQYLCNEIKNKNRLTILLTKKRKSSSVIVIRNELQVYLLHLILVLTFCIAMGKLQVQFHMYQFYQNLKVWGNHNLCLSDKCPLHCMFFFDTHNVSCSRINCYISFIFRTFSTFQHSYMTLVAIIDWKAQFPQIILNAKICRAVKENH